MNDKNGIIYNGVCKITCSEDSKKDGYTTYLNKDNGVKNIKIMFRDGEFVEYNKAYDLQDFLNQVNHYHDLRKDFQTVVYKLLESKPELEDWVKKNFKQYLD